MKKIVEEMKKYDVMMKALIKIANDKKAEIARDYGREGRIYQESLTKIEKEFEAGIAEAKKEIIEVINKEFADNLAKVKAAVVVPIPGEVVNILQAMKLGSLSKAEAKLFADKFAGCYLAKKALHSITDNAQSVFTTYEEMLERMKETKIAAMNWVEHYDNTKYSHEVMISDTSSLYVLDEEIKEFIA